MQFKFDEKIESFLKLIAKTAKIENLIVFFVGGAVRDNILGISSKDVDILVEGNAIDFANKLPGLIKIKSIHSEFGTCKVEYNNTIFDIASTRVEKYPYSGCLPQVVEIGVDITKDVLRRDFTVNSLYCEFYLSDDILEYKLLDYVDGVSDIKNKILKVLHSNSYIDDPTRILRGLGFKYRFGFDFSKNDKVLIENYLKNIQYDEMSVDRVFSVFEKLMQLDCALDIFKEFIYEKYYKILTNKNISVDFDKIFKIKNMFLLNNIQFSEFCLNILKAISVQVFNFNKKVDIIKTFSKFDLSYLAYYFYVTDDPNVISYNHIKDIKLEITGDDLLRLGYPQGQNIGVILDSLYEAKINNLNNFAGKSDEINWVKNNFPLF